MTDSVPTWPETDESQATLRRRTLRRGVCRPPTKPAEGPAFAGHDAAVRNSLRGWMRENGDLLELDNWHGPLALVQNWAWIVLIALAAERQRLLPPIVFYLFIALPLISTRMRGLATMLHEGTHGTLARSPGLNKFLATYPSSYLVLQTFVSYWVSHIQKHHGEHNVLGADPDLDAHIRQGLYDETSRLRFCVRFVLGPFVLVRHPRMWMALIKDRMASGRVTASMSSFQRKNALKAKRELVWMVITNLVFIGFAVIVVGAMNVVLYWVIPLLYGFPIANWFCELFEHFPYPITRRGTWPWHTRQRVGGPLSRRYLSIMNEGGHWLHHQFPKVPFWNVPEAMRRLTRDFPEIAAMTVEQGSDRWHLFGFTRQLRAAIDEATKFAKEKKDK